MVTVDLVRPDDLLNLRIETTNLRLGTDEHKNPVLIVEDPLQPAYLIVIFPPQTIAEGAYFESSTVKPANGGSNRPDPDSVPGKKIGDDELDMPGQLDKSGVAKRTARFRPRLTTAQIGRPSRLVFKVPTEIPDKKPIPFSIEGLLDWSNFELNLNPIAAIGKDPTSEQINSAPDIRQPTPEETAIELPYRLVISPNREATWTHRTGLFTSHGRTELWHTRLTLRTPDGRVPGELSRDNPAQLRAIWSPDYIPFSDRKPDKQDVYLARTAMSPDDRNQIVVLTSAFRGYEVKGSRYLPKPFEAEQLMLSPLGGWLRSRGHWLPPPKVAAPIEHPKLDILELFKPLTLTDDLRLNVSNSSLMNVRDEFVIFLRPQKHNDLNLSEWTHVATQGRDHYVRIVYEGELWPFRHSASLIKVTERRFKENNGIVGAYLMQRMFIVVREPEKKFNHRGNPFKRVRLTTMVTPDIADPYADPDTIIESGSFWVEVNTSATPSRDLFKFHAIATDVSGKDINFTIPLMFVSESDLPEREALAIEYNNSKIERRSADLFGQKVMFAEQKLNDNTQLITQTINFVVDKAGSPPQMLNAEVKIPQVQELLGTDAMTKIRYLKEYVYEGFDGATGVFAQVVKEDRSKEFNPKDPFSSLVADTLGINFTSDKAGGFATPNMAVSMLTRSLGPMAGEVDDARKGHFDGGKFFNGVTAQLFGCFNLSELLESGPTATLEENAPKLLMQTHSTIRTVSLDWKPNVKTVHIPSELNPIASFETIMDRESATTLSIQGIINTPINISGGLPAGVVKSEFTGTLKNFKISVLRSVSIKFTEFRFDLPDKQKPDVKVLLQEGSPLEFTGDLEFVNELCDHIPPNLFGKGSGPSIDLLQDPLGIRAGFAFALPALTVGVFALKDVSLGAALTLPFLDGKPVFDFNVSEREHPFLLAVGIFGGGGFFHLQLDTAGMRELQAALEFGAAAAIDIGGLASGEVHLMAGIYFSLQQKEGTKELVAVLSGYLRMGGSLSVLGLIRISIEFNLSFTYDSGREKAYGRATLTVEVEVAFFSKSIELTVERAFGGKGDPKFGDLFLEAEVWSDYAMAFA